MTSLRGPTIEPPSTKSLLLRLQFGEKILAHATGFIVRGSRNTWLVTARHNLTGRNPNTGKCLSKTGGVPDRLTVCHHSADGLGSWIEITRSLYDADDRPLWREHPLYREEADIAAVEIQPDQSLLLFSGAYDGMDTLYYQTDRTYFEMANYPSSRVSVIGFPFGKGAPSNFPVWTTGFVASEPELNNDGLPLFLIDCRTRPGQSGSPVVIFSKGSFIDNEGGQVFVDGGGPIVKPLGVYAGRMNEESDIGRVWKWTAVCDMLRGTIQSRGKAAKY
jgi:hypothetical protein